ncbi:MAG TPA: MFS transporter [Chthoniobacterales bacterium]
MSKPRLSFFQIWNMSFGFLGIQFGWGLQMANMSAIYEYLGARPDQIARLWIAAPLTGLLVQPMIGAMSDRTWCRLGRRRPYFLVGAILSSLALVAMPNASAVWMAAGLLWILDASINISMEPFRAFVADKLPEEQRSAGFSMQSLFIGLGAVIASGLPWMMTNWFHVTAAAGDAHAIPVTVRYSFYLGAIAFFGAVLWTVLTSPEYPPADLAAFRLTKSEGRGLGAMAAEIIVAFREMPSTMRRLALVQLATWLGLFCMWLYFTPAVSKQVFGAPDAQSPLYRAGNEWAGLCYLTENAVTFLVAFLLLAFVARMNRRHIHSLCLLCGAVGLISVGFIHGVENRGWLHLSLGLVGIAWASILSMPYAILAGALPPEKTGVYMGIFNFFIVLPEIVAALFFDRMIGSVLRNSQVAAVMVGGGFLLLAAVLVQFVRETPLALERLERVIEEEGMLPALTPPETPLV